MDGEDFITAGLEGRLVPGLLKIVKNDLIDTTRNEKRHRQYETTESEKDTQREAEEVITPFLDTVPSPDLGCYDYELAMKEEYREKIEQIFREAKLGARQKEIYQMRHVGQLSYKEIGYKLSITSDNARRIYHDADHKIKQSLGKSR